MTLREIIYDVLERVNAYSDDIKISEEYIAYSINTKRNLLLMQYMSNLRKEIPQEAIQTLCLSLEIDRNCFEDINVLKSIVKIPSTLDNTGRSNIIKAYGGVRFQKNINIIDYSRLPFVAAEKYNDKQLFVAVDPKSYLIVYNSSNTHLLLKQLEIEGVFENPEEAHDLTCEISECTEGPILAAEDCNTSLLPCDFYDAQYPVPSWLIKPMVDQIIQELLLKYQIPLDNINNAENEVKVENDRRRRPQRQT